MENKIISLFAYESVLHFNGIQKKLKVRSNNLAYWLNKLTKESLLVKNQQGYSLAESSEHLVPYLSASKSALPVILIHIGNSRKAFLHKRPKHPYKDLFALPGGRLLIGESPEQAAKRIMKTKFNIEILKPEIKSILIEHVKKKGSPLYSFLLIIIKAYSTMSLRLTKIKDYKRQIIQSDYKIIHLKENKTKLRTINSTYS